MGIEGFSLRMLCEARRRGAAFDSTLTLGRQNLSLHEGEFSDILKLMGRPPAGAGPGDSPWRGVADDLLVELLDIGTLVSMDFSDYEGASVVHDMNLPVPADHLGVYDAIVDTGTLEHVFNFPVAIASCMKMLKVGGRFFSLTPANNHCGHGFYQFSPELFCRLFKDANGFELEYLLAVEHPFPGIELSSRRTVYAVEDPADVGDRVGLVNRHPVYLFVQAVKREEVEPFSPFPQQSDYVAAWGRGGRGGGAQMAPRSLRGVLGTAFWRLHAALPAPLSRPLMGYFQRWYRDTFRNPRNYRRWGRTDPPRGS